MVHQKGLEYGLRKVIQQNMAAHDPTNPAHGTVILMQLIGELDAIAQAKDDDAMLQAIRCHDAMPRIRGYVYKLDQWSSAVYKMSPDQVPEHGARLKC